MLPALNSRLCPNWWQRLWTTNGVTDPNASSTLPNARQGQLGIWFQILHRGGILLVKASGSAHWQRSAKSTVFRAFLLLYLGAVSCVNDFLWGFHIGVVGVRQAAIAIQPEIKMILFWFKESDNPTLHKLFGMVDHIQITQQLIVVFEQINKCPWYYIRGTSHYLHRSVA